jgi:hypothetical protein
MQDLRVGLIGCGFMGRTHSNAYLRLNNFFSVQHRPVLQAVCGRDRGRTEAFARTWGYGRAETDWRRIIEAKDIDLIDICVPNVAHKEIAIAAAQAGKMVVCEKPLAMNVAEGEAMVRAVKAAGVPNQLPPGAGHLAGQTDHRRRQDRPSVPLPRDIFAGLDDFGGCAAGWRGAVAAGRGGCRQWRDR